MSPEIEDFIRSHRVARLATVSPAGAPSVIPICYAYDHRVLYSALDQKPKSVPVTGLKRVRNILANPNVSVVIDDYSDDWSKLAHVTISGTAELIYPPESSSSEEHKRAVVMLREKYLQYRSMAIDANPVIKITIINARLWRSVDPSEF
ncbi:MAG: TIGR03668 family PPOX class F420-dependent oxidoreductase [Blastocatellia bacterium]